MANGITCIRIICSFALLFCLAFSVPFYALYIIAEFSDMIDGTVARKTGTDRFVSVHSVMNKITGGLLFALPLTVRIIDLRYSAAIVCVIATFAAIQEGHYIRTFKSKKL